MSAVKHLRKTVIESVEVTAGVFANNFTEDKLVCPSIQRCVVMSSTGWCVARLPVSVRQIYKSFDVTAKLGVSTANLQQQ